MKVVIRGDKVTEIGKTLTTCSSAESVGIRVFGDTRVELLKRAIEEEMRTEGSKKKWHASTPSDLCKARFNSSEITTKSHGEWILRIIATNL